jgi:hypothetical protein
LDSPKQRTSEFSILNGAVISVQTLLPSFHGKMVENFHIRLWLRRLAKREGRDPCKASDPPKVGCGLFVLPLKTNCCCLQTQLTDPSTLSGAGRDNHLALQRDISNELYWDSSATIGRGRCKPEARVNRPLTLCPMAATFIQVDDANCRYAPIRGLTISTKRRKAEC